MFRTPLAVTMLGFALFSVGCETKEGEDCNTLCTSVFEDCSADCDGDEQCTITCEDDADICVGACDDDKTADD